MTEEDVSEAAHVPLSVASRIAKDYCQLLGGRPTPQTMPLPERRNGRAGLGDFLFTTLIGWPYLDGDAICSLPLLTSWRVSQFSARTLTCCNEQRQCRHADTHAVACVPPSKGQ